jgi:hypothetical protein
MTPRDATRVLWGFATLGLAPERLLLTLRPDWGWRAEPGREPGATGREAGSAAAGTVRSFSVQQLATAVWALAVMEQVDTLPFRCEPVSFSFCFCYVIGNAHVTSGKRS